MVKKEIKYWSFFSNIALKKTFIKSEQSQQYTLRLASFFLSSSWRSSGCCSWWWSVVLAVLSFQNMVHLLPLFFTGGGQSTARIASSNTVFRPRWVSAEHSKYFTAPENQKAFCHENRIIMLWLQLCTWDVYFFYMVNYLRKSFSLILEWWNSCKKTWIHEGNLGSCSVVRNHPFHDSCWNMMPKKF